LTEHLHPGPVKHTAVIGCYADAPATSAASSRWVSLADWLGLLRIGRHDLACLLTCTCAFSFWTYAVTGRLTPGILVLFLCLPVSIYYYMGSLVYAFLLLCVKAFCPLSMSAATFLVTGCSVVLTLVTTRRRPASAQGWPGEYLAVLICLVAATLWSQDLLFKPVREEREAYIYKPWTDYFSPHTKYTAMFLTKRPIFKTDNYECSGQPAMFYHYASYVFPASLAEFGKVPAYNALLAFWTPFGTLLAGLAAYSLATTLWGSSAGFYAILGLYCLPDASFYGFHNGYFGYWWEQQIVPAGNYGVACAALALALVVQGAERVNKAWIATGFFFTCLCLMFKAHVFICIFPLSCLALLVCLPGLSVWVRLAGGLGLIALGVAAIHLASRLHLFPALCIDSGRSTEWFRQLIISNSNERYHNLFDVYMQGQTTYQNPIRSIFIIAGEAFGFLPIFYFLLLAIAAYRRMLDSKCLLPVGAALLYCFFVFCLGKNEVFGHANEFCHRPFVWIYFLFVVFSAALLARLIGSGPPTPRSGIQTLLPYIGLLLCVVPFFLGRGIQHANISFAHQHVDTPVARGLHDCALFLRSQRPATSLIQVSDFDRFWVAGSLSEHPSFLAQPEFWAAVSRAFRASNYEEKIRQVHDLANADTVDKLRDAVASTKIRWFITHPGFHTSWPPVLEDASVFESSGFKVYDLQAIPRITAVEATVRK
jgi:hypothetical protein